MEAQTEVYFSSEAVLVGRPQGRDCDDDYQYQGQQQPRITPCRGGPRYLQIYYKLQTCEDMSGLAYPISEWRWGVAI